MTTIINSTVSGVLPPDYSIRMEVNQYMKEINFIIMFVQLIVLFIGLLGNLLALIVINKRSLRNTSSSVFITYMAVLDSAVLLLHAAKLIQPRRNLFIHCSLTYLIDLFTFCANWVLVIITLERCIAVASPFYAKRFCTVRSARCSVYILFAVAILIFSITFPTFYHMDDPSNRKKCRIRSRYALILRVYQPIVFYALPDILLLSNFYTIYLLIQRREKQKKRSLMDDSCEMRVSDVQSARKQRQLTIMLVTVNLAFYLFTTPAMIMYIAEYFPPKNPEPSKLKRSFLFSQISVVFLQLNNATNFIFYCLAGQRFRQATSHTFRKCSNRFLTFYHRYILCNKNYILSNNHKFNDLQTINLRCSNLDGCKQHLKKTSL